MLSQLDLNLLLVLETVLAERSVVRAARRLHLTPSAISNSLARLRHELGDPLVVRSGRGIVPTPRAVELAPVLARALRDLDQAVYRNAFDPASTTREFTLAIADSGQIVRLPRLARAFGREMPRARLRVVGIDTLLSTGGLGSSAVDVAIAAMPEEPPGVHSVAIAREPTALIVRRDHPSARRGRLTGRQLAALRHVNVEVAPGRGYRGLDAAYAELGIDRDVAIGVPSFTTAAAIVARTDLAATVPASLVASIGDRFGIRAVASPVRPLAIDIKLCWHDRTDQDRAMRAFRELILHSAKEP